MANIEEIKQQVAASDERLQQLPIALVAEYIAISDYPQQRLKP